MSIDATETSVSVSAEEKAQQQNNAVVATEVEAAANVQTGTAAKDPVKLEPGDVNVNEPSLSPREEKMAQIAENRKKQQDQGSQPELSNNDLGLPENYQDDQGGTVTLKVKGKEKDFSAEKVMDAGVRALQKESTADVKLEEAGVKERAVNTRMDELDVREQNVIKREQEIEASRISGGPAPSTDVSAQEGLTDDEADNLVEDLYSGDRAKAREAVKTLEKRGIAATSANQPHIVTAEEVATHVERKTEAKASLKRFNTSFPGIAADNNLKNIVNVESLRIRREHPEYSQNELLMESGKYVAKKYGSRIVDDTGFQEKADRKRQTDTVSGADVTRRPVEEAQPTTRKDAINQLRATRR